MGSLSGVWVRDVSLVRRTKQTNRLTRPDQPDPRHAPLTCSSSATPTTAPAAPHGQFPAIRYPAIPASAALVPASEDLGLHL